MPRVTRASLKNVAFRDFHRENGVLFTVQWCRGRVSGATCVVSKKTAVRATERNQLKRKVRALMKEWGGADTTLVIVTIKKPATTATFEELREEFFLLLARIPLS